MGDLIPRDPDGRSYANVSFIDQPGQRVRHVNVVVRTGMAGWGQRLTIVCHEHTIDYGYTHWVQPHTGDAGEEWLVFQADSPRTRQFLKSLPTREAAEMWVLHHEE